jgi:hypothetical protein
MVVNGNRVIVPLPGSDVDVGVLNPGDRIDIVQQNGAYSVEVVRAKVPAA